MAMMCSLILRWSTIVIVCIIGTNALENKARYLEQSLKTVSRQLMMQQFYVEEQTRSNGDSGLKQIRTRAQGTRPYYAGSHSESSVASIHNHANNDRTIGMGEMIAVLNGVEFRTRHNDYRMKMKSTRNTEYGATEDIPFVSVPPEVKQHTSIGKQVEELRQWFKAWKEQDYSVRDYRPYFKPVLCYLEGSWTNSDQNSIDEPFDSDRHQLDASSWLELQEKLRFTSYSGSKDGLENFAYLPTTVIKLLNGTIPVLAQWNFHILCHPLSRDLPLNRLSPVDDLRARMSMGGATMEKYTSSRAARYQLASFDSDIWRDGKENWDLLDQLMGEIPGMDNYPGSINDTLFGDVAYPYDGESNILLNVARFNRWYRVKTAGAMGTKTRHRGFADGFLFVAQTTQPKVAGLAVERCRKRRRDCITWEQKWTYAIPLEIIYMTPLSSWNPYAIVHKGDARTEEGKSIYSGPEGKRNGKSEPNKAYNGTNSKAFYRTPTDFFNDEIETDPADTTKNSVYVLDSGETVRQVRASGHRIFLPDIPGVGVLRQRYPIMPIHGEGSAVWKELEALKDIVLQPSKYQQMFRESIKPNDDDDNDDDGSGDDGGDDDGSTVGFKTGAASPGWGSHVHHFYLTSTQYKTLERGGNVNNIVTEEVSGHSHTLSLVKKGKKRYLMRTCDKRIRCFDGHGRKVYKM